MGIRMAVDIKLTDQSSVRSNMRNLARFVQNETGVVRLSRDQVLEDLVTTLDDFVRMLVRFRPAGISARAIRAGIASEYVPPSLIDAVSNRISSILVQRVAYEIETLAPADDRMQPRVRFDGRLYPRDTYYGRKRVRFKDSLETSQHVYRPTEQGRGVQDTFSMTASAPHAGTVMGVRDMRTLAPKEYIAVIDRKRMIWMRYPDRKQKGRMIYIHAPRSRADAKSGAYRVLTRQRGSPRIQEGLKKYFGVRVGYLMQSVIKEGDLIRSLTDRVRSYAGVLSEQYAQTYPMVRRTVE